MTNPYLVTFLDGLDTRYPDDSSTLSMSEWVTSHTRLRNRPFSFTNFDFQRQIVDDMHPDLTCMKLSQVGLTEVQIRKFLGFLKRHVGSSGIFALPNQPMRDRVSITRVKPMIDSDPIFNGPMLLEKPTRRKDLYQVDLSFAYLMGNTEGEATSAPADILFVDELDLSDQAMIGLFASRLQASKYKITQRFSTPTYYGFGIDAAYQISDKHEYMLKCTCCNHWQTPFFDRRFLHIKGLPDDVEDLSTLIPEQIDRMDVENAYVKCEECDAPLNLGDSSKREWVPENPSVNRRGYRVRPFSVSNITIPYILRSLTQYQQVDNVKGWFNTTLGEPFNDANARISEENIRACMGGGAIPDPRPTGPVFIGIDVGQTCHVTIGTADHIFAFHQVPQGEIVDFVRNKVKQYNIVGGGMDRYPYTPTSEAVRDATRGIVMPVAYATTPNAPPLKEAKDEFDTITHFVANRTQAIDFVAKQTRNRAWSLQGYGGMQSLVITHMRDMIRIESPDVAPMWQKQTGNDHFLHSLALQQLAVRLRAGLIYNSTDERRTGFLLTGGGLILPKDNYLHKTRDPGVLG